MTLVACFILYERQHSNFHLPRVNLGAIPNGRRLWQLESSYISVSFLDTFVLA